MAKRKQKGRGSSTSRRQATTANSRSPMVLGLLAVAVLGLGLLIWFGVTRTSGRDDMDGVELGASASSAPENAQERTPASVPDGNAAYCRSGPRFPTGLGYAPGQALIGTSLRGYIGLTLSDAADPNRVFQDPSWDDAGSLGSWVYDRQGNIYVAPAPFVSLELNPPDLQNRIYRIDTDTGKMTLFAELPAAAPPSGDNPFGVLGLFYDCDTESLYAGSVAGSTGTDEVGRLFQIDVVDGTVIDTLEGIDAMGVGVFNHPDGKRLYFGRGRDTGLYSIALDEDGGFSGAPELEFFLAAFEDGGNDKVQRITFTQANQMVLKGLPFTYTLQATSDPAVALYIFRIDPEAGASWTLERIERTAASP